MTSDGETVYPTAWFPVEGFPDDRVSLPIKVPNDAWFRLTTHPSRGLPHLAWEVFWITQNVLHLARCEGWATPEAADGVDDRAVMSHERINVETVENYHYKFTEGAGESGWLQLTGGERRTDLPMFLVVSHLSGGDTGYAHTLPIHGAGPARTPADTGLVRVDVNGDATEIAMAGITYGQGHFRIYDEPPTPGIKPCGLWIDGERQYGVRVYQDDEWAFTVPDDRAFADWVYDRIEHLQ